MTTLRQIYYSFPTRLLILHWRNHLFLILVWAALLAMMTGQTGRYFGMHYLLLAPEYQGKVNFLSFFITGAAFGTFVMIWNLTTYLLSANRFSFLASLFRPFTKFCLNNSLIPLCFLFFFIGSSAWFQWLDEFFTTFQVVMNIAGFLAGTLSTILLIAAYLYFTNKDIGAFLRPGGKFFPKPGGKLLISGQRLPTLADIRKGTYNWRVDTYLNERIRPRLVRSVAHYNAEMLEQVFRQNHFNAVFVQVLALLILVVLGVFMDSPYVRIPAAATVYIVAGMVTAVFGAITFWFRIWGLVVFIGILVAINAITGLGWFHYRNRAYGINYEQEKRPEYTYAALEKISTRAQVRQDRAATLEILENWLAKNKAAGRSKPKMVLINVSGGGLRSALWTMQTLQQADKALGGNILDQTALITGASGGMLGAAYLRESMLRHPRGLSPDPHHPSLMENMGKDLLNAVCFGVVSNDLFYPLTSFQSGGMTYKKDRGYLFEKQLNENCQHFFEQPLSAYKEPEKTAKIPMMVLSPFIMNDARRLLISPQGVSYLMRPYDDGKLRSQVEIDGVDFGRFFKEQQVDSLRFSTALRMNCTFPFILPNVWMPTYPSIEVMDAGVRDNYGLDLSIRFVHTFKDWIMENTDGVVFLQIRCWEKLRTIRKSDSKGIIDNLFDPLNTAVNMTDNQDFSQDQGLALLDDILGKGMLHVVRFAYRPVRKQREASMNFHLSQREKLDLREAYYMPENQAALKALKVILR